MVIPTLDYLKALTWMSRKQVWKECKNKVNVYSTNLCMTLPANGIGIDPGKNWGVAVVWKSGEVMLWQGRFIDREDKMYGISSREIIMNKLRYEFPDVANSLVEGASYGDTYGQVPLAEIRFGFYTALKDLQYPVEYIPPSSTRKFIFGKGTIQPMDIWIDINHNAADAFSIALAASNGWKKSIDIV